MSEMRFLIPENLDIDKVIEENKEIFYGNKLKKAQLLYMLDALAISRARNRKQMEDNKTPFAPLWGKLLQSVVRKYNHYINFLLSEEILITDKHFIPGEKCRGYCYNYPYNGQPYKEVVIEDLMLNRAIKRAARKHEEEIKKAMKGYGYITKWWDNGKLQIDKPSAYKWIDEYTHRKIESINANASIRFPQIEIENANNTAEDFKYLVRSIKARNYNYGFSGQGHRFYNPISNLKKELRNFLTYDGKPLVDIDIKNSQPFLSLVLFNAKFWEAKVHFKEKSLKYLLEDVYEDIRSSKYYNSIITLVKSYETQYSIGLGFTEYRDLVLSGGFYEHIQDNFSSLYPNKFDERSKVKIEVLRILYSNPKLHWLGCYKPCHTFKSFFPGVSKLFNDIKLVKQNYLPIILQRIESYLVLDVICKAISKLHPHIPLFTIHDNIITTKGNELIVEAIMRQEMHKWTGYEPKFGIEDLSSLKIAA